MTHWGRTNRAIFPLQLFPSSPRGDEALEPFCTAQLRAAETPTWLPAAPLQRWGTQPSSFPGPQTHTLPPFLHETPSSALALREGSFLPHRGRFCPAAGSHEPSTPPQQFPALRAPPAAFPRGHGSPATPSTGSRSVCSPPPREQRPRLRWLSEGTVSVSWQRQDTRGGVSRQTGVSQARGEGLSQLLVPDSSTTIITHLKKRMSGQ